MQLIDRYILHALVTCADCKTVLRASYKVKALALHSLVLQLVACVSIAMGDL